MTQPLPTTHLGIDVGLDKLDIALRDPTGRLAIAHQTFSNNAAGYATLKLLLLSQLRRTESSQLSVALESTGNYWWHVAYNLSHDDEFDPYELQLHVLNPAHVKNHRGSIGERDKDDASDAQLIEHYQRTALEETRQPYDFQMRYLPLRHWARAYCRLSHMLASDKGYCLSLLYLFNSEYMRQRPFSDPFAVSSLHLLSSYPDIAALADLPTDELAAQLQGWARGKLADPVARASQIQQVTEAAFRLPEPLNSTVHQLLDVTFERIRFLEQQKAELKGQIEVELEQLPEAKLALAYKGLGPILVAGVLGEIGDPLRYVTGEKYDRQRKRYRPRRYKDGQAAVAKMAGLWWPKQQSGRWQGQQTKLARERNPFLRYWLVQTAFVLTGHQDDYAAYYSKKFAESQHHQHKRALILTARKAVRLLFALLHKGQVQRLEEANNG